MSRRTRAASLAVVNSGIGIALSWVLVVSVGYLLDLGTAAALWSAAFVAVLLLFSIALAAAAAAIDIADALQLRRGRR